jgi:hypothetical protein
VHECRACPVGAPPLESRLQPERNPRTFRRLKAGLQLPDRLKVLSLISLLLVSCGCLNTAPTQLSTGSTTGALPPGESAKDAAALALRDDLDSLPSAKPTPATPAAEPIAAVAESDVQPAAESPAAAPGESGQTAAAPSESWPNFRNGADLRHRRYDAAGESRTSGN